MLSETDLGNKYSVFYIFILSSRILHRRDQNSGITDPWVTMAAKPHTGPALRILCNSLSTLTERLNNLLKVTQPTRWDLKPASSGLTAAYTFLQF